MGGSPGARSASLTLSRGPPRKALSTSIVLGKAGGQQASCGTWGGGQAGPAGKAGDTEYTISHYLNVVASAPFSPQWSDLELKFGAGTPVPAPHCRERLRHSATFGCSVESSVGWRPFRHWMRSASCVCLRHRLFAFNSPCVESGKSRQDALSPTSGAWLSVL